MALGITLLGAVSFTTTAGDKTVVATPVAGSMIVIVAIATGFTAISCSDNNTDGHGTYGQIVSALKSTSADQLAAFVRADPVRKSVSTTFTSVQTGSSGGGLAVFAVSGAAISGPAFVRQSGLQSNQASGTAATPMGTGAVLTANGVMAAFMDTTASAPTLTVPTGFTSIVNTNYSTPGTGIQIAFANTGVTASTITWGTAAPSAFCDIAFELKADLAGHYGMEEEQHDDPFSIQALDRASMLRSSFFMRKWERRRSGILVPA